MVNEQTNLNEIIQIIFKILYVNCKNFINKKNQIN